MPSYLEGSPEVRIALLHLDMDVYEPTRFALETCFELVVQGGLIVIDDYGAVSGATRATDEFAAERDLVIRKLPYYRVPAFITR